MRPPCCASRAWASPQPVPRVARRAAARLPLTHPELIDWGLRRNGRHRGGPEPLVSFAEKAIDDGKLDTILVPRVSEVPSRSCAPPPWTTAGKGNVPEKVVLTPTCELMQIVVLPLDGRDFRARVQDDRRHRDGKAVTFGDSWTCGVSSLAFWPTRSKPAKTETVNGSPVHVHGGPFANVSIGHSDVGLREMACAPCMTTVIVEAGYGTDAGAQEVAGHRLPQNTARSGRPAAIVVTRASPGATIPSWLWRYRSTCSAWRTGHSDLPAHQPVGSEDDQVPSLKATADELGFRTPIIGNLFRDGGEALAPQQLDGFWVDALQNGSMPAEPYSHKGHGLTGERHGGRERLRRTGRRAIYKPGSPSPCRGHGTVCQSAGISLDDLAFVAVKSPATMTDNDHCAPEEERTVTLKKVEVHAGAGLVHVNLTTSLTTPAQDRADDRYKVR